MAKLEWGQVGTRIFEAGVDRGALFVGDLDGVAWNGLLNVNLGTSGGDLVEAYIDGFSYYQDRENQETTFSIEAYTYPEEFEACDGTDFSESCLGLGNQDRDRFDLSYRTLIGNDTEGVERGYKLHFLYNCLAAPSSKSYSSLSEDLDPITFTWDVTTLPASITRRKPTSYLFVDSTKTPTRVMQDVEAILYGSSTQPPRMPRPKELVDIFDRYLFKINENYTSGISTLTSMLNQPGEADLMGDLQEGLYKRTRSGRLSSSPSNPNVYILE